MVTSGCTKKPFLQETLENYSQRLSNVLDAHHQIALEHNTEQVPEKLSNTPALPGEQTSQSIQLRDFYKLPDCGIKPIIAERNTTMGKIQAPSQRYLYDVRLVQALEHCINRANPEDHKALKAILTTKRLDMQSSWREFLDKSKEIRLAIVSGNTHFGPSENHDFALLSWLQLQTFSPEQYNAQDNMAFSDLETHLKTISDYKTPAKFINDSRLIANGLPQITRFLQTETEAFTCVSRKEKQKVEYLRNVFHLFFIEKIQPLTTNMNKWYYKLEPVMDSLVAPLAMGQEDTLSQKKNPLKQHKQRYDHSLKQHVQFWQQLFKRCEVSPVK